MRLTMISQDFPPDTGGIQTYTLSHATHMANWCSWLGVICPNKQGSAEIDDNLDFPVYRLKSRNELLAVSLLTHLKPILREHPSDAVFHSQWQTAAASIRARRAGLIGKVFVAAHIRELLFNPYEKIPGLNHLFLRYRQWILNETDHFYPVSEYTAGKLEALGVEPSRMTVVINGTDPRQFYPTDAGEIRRKLGIDQKKVILTITRLVPRKGIDTVLQALSQVAEHVPDVHYLIVGDGNDKPRLEQIIHEKNLNEMVTFTGKVPYHEINTYYNAGDLFVMPSRTQEPDVEGFGIVFLEANACGLPVIGSDSGGIPSAIEDGRTGYIIPEGDVSELADKIIYLLTHPGESKKIGENGRRMVEEKANWNTVSRKLFDDLCVRLTEQVR